MIDNLQGLSYVHDRTNKRDSAEYKESVAVIREITDNELMDDIPVRFFFWQTRMILYMTKLMSRLSRKTSEALSMVNECMRIHISGLFSRHCRWFIRRIQFARRSSGGQKTVTTKETKKKRTFCLSNYVRNSHRWKYFPSVY